MVDPRKACMLMRRPKAWVNRKKSSAPEQTARPRTYQFTPRGDVDTFVKFFSGDVTPPENPDE